jgi:hypothetical protein
MLRSVFNALETGTLAEISLLAFVFGFALILIRVLTLPKEEVREGKNMPLEEPVEHYSDWSSQIGVNGSTVTE